MKWLKVLHSRSSALKELSSPPPATKKVRGAQGNPYGKQVWAGPNLYAAPPLSVAGGGSSFNHHMMSSKGEASYRDATAT